ncbi:putative pilus system protein FilA [Acinetobacter haemolyticus]|uniref:putative pilus system protein FilA n=1 Tax=Acinetobacter haemolyticus TaxID=29430 RepID=UPI0002DCBD57|nr:DUF6160 family protein [Acinetobacter haemolyticus]WHR58791.1 protein FilA [Acinetobacter haemolyticus]
MKMFTKLVLVSSMAISANAMAMQSMDDAALSATTGQDGITLNIKTTSGISIDNLYIHDNDGYNSSNKAGAIVISGNGVAGHVNETAGVVLSDVNLDLVIDSDGGASAGGAFLNVLATVGAMDIDIGSIGVGTSGTLNTTTAVRGATDVNEILTGLSLSLGEVTANVQLGATPQGAMIKIDSELQGGLTISNLGLKDNGANGGGVIHLDNIYVRGTGGSSAGDLVIDADINVTTNGLEITNNDNNAMNVYIQGVRLGSNSAASIGDVEVNGLRTGGSTITISGH